MFNSLCTKIKFRLIYILLNFRFYFLHKIFKKKFSDTQFCELGIIKYTFNGLSDEIQNSFTKPEFNNLSKTSHDYFKASASSL